MSESLNSNPPTFVVVKVDEPLPWPEQETFYPILPTEEPHTYGTLQRAVELVASLIEDFGYTTQNTRIYRLVPVADEDTLPLIQNALTTLQQDGE
ncbi:hypothetical protein IQ268_12405 [Oculatella sp. LEGE 06141]|jgi:hypothetical protein|uniref:hypothetical protein n=1 Tax=Oculatella sp. LEGE 06141 TaxID=1828648 RepID=UPI0018811EB3|nr:hypothetical protein [Oculatella sp. LEGE 06141]MBE9179364.1 hypothetical protein [Oculatella sp. LEGE 06141]